VSKSNKTILIVEDAADIQALLSSLLRSEGYQVECASDGREGLEKLRNSRKPFELILLDLMMAGMDGFEFCKELHKDAGLATIPVIVMTADGDIKDKANQVGAKAFLKKPFMNLELILGTVRGGFK
jgi:CheY-like chemotaxis protein